MSNAGVLSLSSTVGTGTVTSFSFTDGSGFDGTVTNPTTTPNLSLTTSISSGHVLVAGTLGAITGPTDFEYITSRQTLLVGNVVSNLNVVSSTPYVVASSDYYLSVDSSGGAITIQLPNAAPNTGRIYFIKDATGSAATHAITVTTVGGAVLIDNATSKVINTNYGMIAVIFNDTKYEILGLIS